MHLDKLISKVELSSINYNHFIANLGNVCFGNPEDLMARIDRDSPQGIRSFGFEVQFGVVTPI